MPANDRHCHTDQDDISSKGHDRLSNTVLFSITLKNPSDDRILRKKFSVDLQLLSYSFLVRLINRTFHLHSNFTIVAKESSALKCDFVISDDFDVDGCMMNSIEENDTNVLEFLVYQYPRTKEQIQAEIDDWCICEDPMSNSKDKEENFEILQVRHDSVIVTIKPQDVRQESFLRKATGWLHGSVNSPSSHSLTKKEFFQMLDSTTGRLIDESALRQRVFDDGCDESIRKIVWCYLLRVFNESMSNADKTDYTIKAKQSYNEKKSSWQRRYDDGQKDVIALENLIQKDVRRTDRCVKFFDDKENLSQQKLFHVLMTYSVDHPLPGYVQGMNDMAAALLYVIRDESLTYFCFRALMCHMSPLFHINGIAMQRRLNLLKKTLQSIDRDLWSKIEQCDVGGKLMFTYRWLLLDCKREFPFKNIFRVLETLWASLPADRFESSNHFEIDNDDVYPSMVNRTSTVSSIFSTCSSSPHNDETQSQHSSFDGADSGYRDEHLPSVSESSLSLTLTSDVTVHRSISLGKWLIHFATSDDDEQTSDMFTIFLAVALIEQHRSAIMQMSSCNTDHDDLLASYFTRLVRQHDARHALELAKNYHRQYLLFQMRKKQLFLSDS